MTFLYGIVYRLVVFVLLPRLYRINKKVAEGYRLRSPQKGRYPWLIGPQKTHPFWIHCASGEFEYALPVIREMKRQNPDTQIMVTYFTPSYAQKIKNHPLVDLVYPSPWDTPHVISEFIEYHQPRALLFARTDVWFEMTRQCKKHNIPVAVFSMTVRPVQHLKKIFYRWRWQFIDQFFVVSEQDQAHLSELLPSAHIQVLGDSRYDQCAHRLQEKKPLPLQMIPTHKPWIVAGSTWPEDEKVLLSVIPHLMPTYDWILVPHEVHTEHLDALQRDLERQNVPFVLASKTSEWAGDCVLIFDKVGFLAELYPYAKASFIGGSFRKQVHSVMESLACGCITFVGPHYQNNREAIEFSQSSPQAVHVAQTAAQLIDQINHAVPRWTEQKKHEFLTQFQQKMGVSQKLAHVFLQQMQ